MKYEDRRKGGTRKIGGPPKRPCQDPAHNPPSHMVFEPGTYEHICPTCGNRQTFIVNPIVMKS